MATKKPLDNAGERKPVAEQFNQFEKDHGGDAVNAHDERMDSILHENAEQLDSKYGSQDSGDR